MAGARAASSLTTALFISIPPAFNHILHTPLNTYRRQAMKRARDEDEEQGDTNGGSAVKGTCRGVVW